MKIKNKELFEFLGTGLSFTDFKSEIQEMQAPILYTGYYYYSLYGQYCEYWREDVPALFLESFKCSTYPKVDGKFELATEQDMKEIEDSFVNTVNSLKEK